jgi:hypothetical protein
MTVVLKRLELLEDQANQVRLPTSALPSYG